MLIKPPVTRINRVVMSHMMKFGNPPEEIGCLMVGR